MSCRVLILSGSAMLGYLDLCVGSFIAMIVAKIVGVDVGLQHLLAGALLAVSPDIDIPLIILFRKKEIIDHHETITHNPLFMVPTMTCLTWYFWGPMWASIAVLCVLWHFIHDSEGVNEGSLAWFKPFTNLHWTPLKPLVLSEPKKNEFVGGYASLLHKYWLQPSTISVQEMVLGSLCLLVSVSVTDSMLIGMVAFVLSWLGIAAVWSSSPLLVKYPA